MFRYETLNIILMIIILITKDIQIIALDLHYKSITDDLRSRSKRLKQNEQKQDQFYPINKKIFNEYLSDNQMTNDFKQIYSNKDAEEYYEKESLDQNYDYEFPDFINSQIYRREVPTNCAYAGSLQNSSLYPSVLTKALEISLNSSTPINKGESLFSNVAQKMNTSALVLAKILTKSENSNTDDQFAKMIENYKKTKGQEISNPSVNTLTQSIAQNIPNNVKLKLNQGLEDDGENPDEHIDGFTTSNIAEILDRVLNKLESIHKVKNNDDEEHPDGVPCDIIGSWSSTTLGFCFDMQLFKEKYHYIPPAEINNKILSINLSECIPAKHHQIIDMEWKFTGSAIKQWGGPFYMYGQKRSEGTVATFLGFCRTCNGMDNIFGSWNFLSPTKDCHDVSLGNNVKQDILRRVRMELKRKERFKDLLYQSRHGKL